MFDAGNAVQLALKTLLHAELTDVFGASVIGLVIIVFDFFFFALVNAPDVADHMAGQFAVRVIAKQAGLDLYAGKAKTLGCKACHLDIGQAIAQRQGLKSLGLVEQFFEAAAVARCDFNDLG